MNISTELGFFTTGNPVALHTKFRQGSVCWKIARRLNSFTFEEPSPMPTITNKFGRDITATELRKALSRVNHVLKLGGYCTATQSTPALGNPQEFVDTLYVTVFRNEE